MNSMTAVVSVCVTVRGVHYDVVLDCGMSIVKSIAATMRLTIMMSLSSYVF